MSPRLVAAGLIHLSFQGLAFPHRLDEYLQTATFSLKRDRVEVEMVLTPGVAVFGRVMTLIDRDRDGLLSDAEQQAYATRVLNDLSITIDQDRRELTLTSVSFPLLSEMKQGLGGIRIGFAADLPGAGSVHTLVLVNTHEAHMSTYMVNSLVPNDPDIRITAQDRNYEQSRYELDFSQDQVRSTRGLSLWLGALLGSALFLLLAGLGTRLRSSAGSLAA